MTITTAMAEFSDIPEAGKQGMLELAERYQKDPSPKKVVLGAGTYRTEDGRPWVLPSFVKAAERMQDDYDHEYIPFSGSERFLGHARSLVLSDTSLHARTASIQTVGGSGAVHLGAAFLHRFANRPKTVLIPAHSWENHEAMFQHVGYETATYPYWSAATMSLDFEGMCAALADAPDGTIVVLHACGHNPTGCDPTGEQWLVLRELFQRKGHFAYFDDAYQGFVSGDMEEDGKSLTIFAGHVPMLVAQSFSKNAGLYGQRIGALHILCSDSSIAVRVRAQLTALVRREISSPPKYGANLVSIVCEDDELFAGWMADIKVMSNRIAKVRRLLVAELARLGTPGKWSCIARQQGMFGFTGLTPAQCTALEEHHVYCPPTGRISIAGLNAGNVAHVASAIDNVVRAAAAP